MEELNTALAGLIEQATTGIDASVGFLQAQLPDVVVQLLMWHGVKSGVMCALGILILMFLIKVERIAFASIREYLKTEHGKKDDAFYVWGIGYGLVGIIPRLSYLIPLFMINLTWLQIWIAPKVWLLEYAANLVK